MFLSLRLIVRYFQCFVRGSSPSGKVVFHEPPYPSEITAFEPPSPSEFTMIFRGLGGGMDIFWNHTITCKSRMPSDFENETLHYTKFIN